jgi:ER-bound oxygenase mpaB/B'/Rubber oxygenase, catalytic domain
MVTTSPLETIRDFVDCRSIVRTIWGDADVVLLIFAGSAAEFALNRAVDWLFFTGEIPRDPIGRLFSTVRYAQEIVFVDEETARRTLDRINAQHSSVEHQRGTVIPDWAYRDVLYMLIDYSERAYELLYKQLSPDQKRDLFEVFQRIGEALHVSELPETYEEWRVDRHRHLVRDLIYSKHTALLYDAYRRHLGVWRYYLLLEVQALLVPAEVRRLLHLNPSHLVSGAVQTYGIVRGSTLRSVAHTLLIPSRYWSELQKIGARKYRSSSQPPNSVLSTNHRSFGS